jgi:betaine/carnitine transporter, BCCT family
MNTEEVAVDYAVNEHEGGCDNSPSLDKRLFWPALAVIFGVTIPMISFPNQAKPIVDAMFAFTTTHFGWAYLLLGVGALFGLFYVAFSRYGQIKLGGATEKAQFSDFSWGSMIFAAGMGIALMNWAFVEPLYLMSSPPLGIEAGSTVAVEWAAMYGLFHWGLVPWAIYTLPAVPIGYVLHVRKSRKLRMSSACEPVLGRFASGHLGTVIDLMVIFGLIGGVGTSLGLSVPLVSTLLSEITGLADDMWLMMGVLVVWVALFSYSVYRGLDKGIKILSDINVLIASLLLVFVLLSGPTSFLFDLAVNSTGLFLDNFFRISTWTDPVTKGGFPESWTVFYWAWWLAFAPMVGLFIARISRGRTLRNVILGAITWGTLSSCVFFMIMGGYALYLQTAGVLDVVTILNSQGIPQAVVAILETMPASTFVMLVFVVLSFIFLATTLDSTAYVLALISSRNLSGEQEPTRASRMIWCYMIAVIAVAMLVVGGLKVIQTLSIVCALPLIPIVVIAFLSVLKAMKQDFGKALYLPEYALEKVQEQLVVVRADKAAAVQIKQH